MIAIAVEMVTVIVTTKVMVTWVLVRMLVLMASDADGGASS